MMQRTVGSLSADPSGDSSATKPFAIVALVLFLAMATGLSLGNQLVMVTALCKRHRD